MRKGLLLRAIGPLEYGGGPSVPRDGPSNVYIPQTAAHWGILGLPAPSTQVFGGILAGWTPNGNTVSNQTVTGWTSRFAGLDDVANADSWRGSGLNALLNQSYACLSYIQAISVAANGRRLACYAGGTWGLRINTNGTIVSQMNTAATGASNHLSGNLVRPYLAYRRVVSSTSGTMSNLESISNTYTGNAFPVGNVVGYGAENAVRAAASRCLMQCFWFGTDAETIGQKATLVTLGWPMSW